MLVLSKYVDQKRLGCNAGRQEASRWHTKGESEDSIVWRQRNMQMRYPPWVRNLGQTSLEVQNRDISGPTKRTDVLQKF